MFDDAKEGEPNSESDAKRKGVEDCGEENKGHKEEFGPGVDMQEEENVVGGFFDEGIGYYRDHGRENDFLSLLISVHFD